MAKVAIPPKVSMKKDNIANEKKISITKNGVKTNNMTKNIYCKCFKKGNDRKTKGSESKERVTKKMKCQRQDNAAKIKGNESFI